MVCKDPVNDGLVYEGDTVVLKGYSLRINIKIHPLYLRSINDIFYAFFNVNKYFGLNS